MCFLLDCLALLFRAVLWQLGICRKGGDGGFMFMLLPQKRKNYKEQKQQSWKCKTAWQLNVMLDMICCCLVLYTSILHCVFLFTFCLVPSGRTVWLLQKTNLMWLHFFFFFFSVWWGGWQRKRRRRRPTEIYCTCSSAISTGGKTSENWAAEMCSFCDFIL